MPENKSCLFPLACNTFTDCESCLANRGIRYNCSWCGTIQKCSNGYDRSRYQWVQASCHHFASENTCSISTKSSHDVEQFLSLPSSSSSVIHAGQLEPFVSSTQYSVLYTLRTIIITLFTAVLILSLIVFFGTYIYAYRYPTSAPGIWLLEHRPSNYIERLRSFSGLTNGPH